ncbi:MAG: adenylate/guanylate cyclase domain-containing protein [Sinimarinibacterium sp.]
MHALTLTGCRLLAVYCAIEAIAGLAVGVQILLQVDAVDATVLGRIAAARADPVILALLSLLLWFGASLIARRVAAFAPLPGARAADVAPHLVRFAGVLLAIGALTQLATPLWSLASAAAPLPVAAVEQAGLMLGLLVKLVAGSGLAVGATSVAGWLASDVPEVRTAPALRDDASLGELLGDLVGAAGLLGVRRVSELALAVKSEAEDVARRVVKSSLDRVISAVEQRRPDFSAATAADGQVTIVFSDMEGFSTMTERLGDAAAHQVIKAHNRIVRRAVRRHRGQEVELQGDGFLLAFPDPEQALRSTIEIQKHCAEYSLRHPDTPVRVRIGVHCGTPIKEGDRFFGITVILAARIAAQARGAETLVSETVRDRLGGAAEFGFDGGRDAQLKGLSGTHRMYALLREH